MRVADYYEVIGVSRGSGAAEVERKIREELRVWHRRTNSADLRCRQQAEVRVQQLTEARAALQSGGLAALAAEAEAADPTPLAELEPEPVSEPDPAPVAESADDPVPASRPGPPPAPEPARNAEAAAQREAVGNPRPGVRSDHVNFYLAATSSCSSCCSTS